MRRDDDAQQNPYFTTRSVGVLRHMRRKVRPYPLLLLANSPLLQEMRRPLQGAARSRSQMDLLVENGLGRVSSEMHAGRPRASTPQADHE